MTTTELIKQAKQALSNMLERCLKKGEQPSYLTMFYEGYAQGSNKEPIKDEWHWIELEGLPNEDGKYYLLCEYDGWYEAQEGGWYEIGDKLAPSEHWNGFNKVVAWFKLPEAPEYKSK